jgi:segregation and condensation protein A
MDVASDFLEVAATLLQLKAASLLPEEVTTFGDELDDISPAEAREILIARLIAYKQFKNTAAALGARLEAESRMHARQAGLEQVFLGLLPDYLEGVTLHALAVICADLAARREVFLLEAEHIAAKPLPVELHIESIVRRLEQNRQLTFSQLMEGSVDPTYLVVGFLALLELFHRGMIDIEQGEQYGEIEIVYRNPDEWAPATDNTPKSAVDAFIESLQPDGEEDE